MSLKYLLDEHVPHALRSAAQRFDPSLVVRVMGEPGCPPIGTLDPEILKWCELNGFVLVTNNRRSMPIHLKDHIDVGRRIPGIFILKANWTLARNAEHMALAAIASFPDEYENQIRNFPV